MLKTFSASKSSNCSRISAVISSKSGTSTELPDLRRTTLMVVCHNTTSSPLLHEPPGSFQVGRPKLVDQSSDLILQDSDHDGDVLASPSGSDQKPLVQALVDSVVRGASSVRPVRANAPRHQHLLYCWSRSQIFREVYTDTDEVLVALMLGKLRKLSRASMKLTVTPRVLV